MSATTGLSTPCNSKHIGWPTAIQIQDSHRWGVILAGGNGERLLPLTRRITGDDRPKQFCALTGGETLLKQTRRRVAPIISGAQTLLFLTRTHERYYRDDLTEVPSSCLLIQPYNRGTALAIAYSLTHLRQVDPQGFVAFFPSDHYFANEEAFVAQTNFAFVQARANPARVILIGIEPEAPEEAYGWIEPGAPLAADSIYSISEVSRFWEKPSRRMAARLMLRGCLWNSFVMVGSVEAFINMIRHTLPNLLMCLESICATTDRGLAEKRLSDLYLTGQAMNFSDEVLAERPSDLAVIHARGLGWSDLGEPERVFSMLRRMSEDASGGQ